MDETLSLIGEFGLIERIHRVLEREGVQAPGLRLGLGDDTACFSPEPGRELLVTCDSLVEGRHYLPDRITPLELGRRSMTLNISDIGAMGGEPKYALISLGLRPDTRVSDVEDLYRGFLAELNPFDASVIGGNLTRARDAQFIDITLIGQVEAGKWVRRSTARAGDAILVTGYPGHAAAGLHLLLAGPGDSDVQNHPLVRAYNTPSHRAWEGRAVAQAQSASSRAVTLLARKTIMTSGTVAYANPMVCSSCGVCVEICPYSAPSFIKEGPFAGKAEVNPVLCKGCGLCVASCRSGALKRP